VTLARARRTPSTSGRLPRVRTRIRTRMLGRRGSHRLHWWIVAQHGEKEVLLGPFPDIETANREGYLTNAYFNVYEWPTRDRARATQIYKEVRLQKTQDLGKSLERVQHTLDTREERQ